MSANDERRAGRTAAQMRDAPKGATFVWCNDRPAYARDLARSLGRADLHIEALSALEFGGHRLGFGRAVVVDHAVVSTPRIAAGLRAVDALNERASQRRT